MEQDLPGRRAPMEALPAMVPEKATDGEGIAGLQDGAPAQGGSPVRRGGDFVLVGDQEHGGPVLREDSYGVQDPVQGERVDAGIRLVENGELGSHREDGCPVSYTHLRA